MGRLALQCAAFALVSAQPALLHAKAAAVEPRTGAGQLAGGAQWRATVPANWNGTLLVWGHGYSPVRGPAEDAPKQHREALLALGYAIAGSSYREAGWALASAPDDQLGTVKAFAAQFGKPKRIIAWGMSMGALVTTAMVERQRVGIDGGIALCGSIGGAVGMMNMGLDGAYTFRTLLAPQSAIQLVGIKDDRANGAQVAAALSAAQETPQGRARVALAGVLAGIPEWTGGERPAEGDFAAEQANIARTFAMGVFLPRADQEQRAAGVFSWNDGVDYRRQLALSGRSAMVRGLYAAAKLDLDADLARLNESQRVVADPGAVQWMMANYTPNARPRVPLLAIQNIGDGITSPSLQQAYAEAAAAAGQGRNVRSLWLASAGHCTFDSAAIVDAVRLLEQRIAEGRWPARPARFIDYTPPPMLRPCTRGAGGCR
jgi:pimeloyl-ACP methyl ester carboxylesterase